MSNDPPKRRWYQFSLRTMGVLLAVASVFCGWRADRAWKNRQRVAAHDKAVVEILKLGGTVGYEYKPQQSQSWLEDLFDDPGGPDDPVSGRSGWWVTLSGDDKIDACLEHLKIMKNFDLRLNSTNVTDAGLEHLKVLTNLIFLYLYNTKVTNDGVKMLQQALPNCKIHTNHFSPLLRPFP